ncbi:hypothetical protein [Campylobacter sp. US33a]|uniref:Lipooligosaccharide transport system, substrate-binding component (LptC family) n=1 Tax=Campylobacter sp. CCS1377 TaxID=3158229 RepID=A0AAU7E699_9BACT|nr:hypothetical protein [Campylobacter sp. US33a]TEY01178.1 hypothetical protein ELQ16_08080 [Campylobacter sp. US33a]
MSLFAIILAILGTQDPYMFNFKSYNLDIKNIQANEITVYELNSSSVNSSFMALSWSRYKDKDVFYDFKAFYPDYNVSSLVLNIFEDKAEFQGNVNYEDINQTRINAQEVFYNIKDKNITSDKEFYVYKGTDIIFGQKLEYDMINKKLKIMGAKAWLGE